MTTNEKRYYIVDRQQGNYYKLSSDNNLVLASDSVDATLFSYEDADKRIGSGRKAHYYTVLEATGLPTPTLLDQLNNNWKEKLTELCYLSSHTNEYQNNLNQMLSDVDKEICDLLHFLEFNDPDNATRLQVVEMLQQRSRRRREIKNEIEKIALMKENFLDDSFALKLNQCLEHMERMQNRIYTPRKLKSLFEEQADSAIA